MKYILSLFMCLFFIFACSDDKVNITFGDNDLESESFESELSKMDGDLDNELQDEKEVEEIIELEKDIQETEVTEKELEKAEKMEKEVGEKDTEEKDMEENDIEKNRCHTEKTIELSCNDSWTHDTRKEGLANKWQGYSCSARYEGGRETIYSFVTDADCEVQITLNEAKQDLNIFVLRSCEPMDCLTFSSVAHVDEEVVNFKTTSGKQYYVTIDGYVQAEGEYTLTTKCQCMP